MSDQPQSKPEDPIAQPPATKKRRRWLSVFLIILGVFILAFIAIQFIPVNETNPPTTAAIQWDSPQTQVLAQQACMDCHSNETVWPWYTHIAPVSWLTYYDVMRGRSQLNFSTLGSGQAFGERNQPQDLAYRLGQILAGGSRRGPGGREFNGQPPQSFQEGQPPQGGTSQPPQEQAQGFPAGGFAGRLAERITESIQSGNMPPTKYTLIHSGARLSSDQVQQLLKGLLATFKLSQ